MTLYGLYIRNLAEGDLVWFTTDKPLKAGTYNLAQADTSSPDVFIAESIPALILRVGPIIDQAQNRAQKSLSTNDIPPDTEQQIAEDMTAGLLEKLTQTSSIWDANPDWIDKLRLIQAANK